MAKPRLVYCSLLVLSHLLRSLGLLSSTLTTLTSCTDQSNASSLLPVQVVYKTNDDHVTVVGAGVTLHEALAAAEQLKKGSREKNEHESLQHLSQREP